MSIDRKFAAETRPVRRAANISLNAGILAEAKELGINISRACEGGLAAEIARVRRETWLAQNRPALESSNAFAEANGLPLAALRQF